MISSAPSADEILVSILSSPLERAGRFLILVGLVENSVATQTCRSSCNVGLFFLLLIGRGKKHVPTTASHPPSVSIHSVLPNHLLREIDRHGLPNISGSKLETFMSSDTTLLCLSWLFLSDVSLTERERSQSASVQRRLSAGTLA